jgi:hypothetical protein
VVLTQSSAKKLEEILKCAENMFEAADWWEKGCNLQDEYFSSFSPSAEGEHKCPFNRITTSTGPEYIHVPTLISQANEALQTTLKLHHLEKLFDTSDFDGGSSSAAGGGKPAERSRLRGGTAQAKANSSQ